MLVAHAWTRQSPLQMIALAAAVSVVYCLALLRPILASPLGPYLLRGAEGVRHFLHKPVGPVSAVEKVGVLAGDDHS